MAFTQEQEKNLDEFGLCWKVLGNLAEGFQQNTNKRMKAIEEMKLAEQAIANHLEGIKRVLRKLDSLTGTADVREHVIWRLHESEWDSTLIMEVFNLSKQEYDDIIYRKFEEFWEARVTRLRALPYKEYLKTPEWQKTRQTILSRDHHRCQLCNSIEKLNVHHKSYENIGDEHHADLITLCQDCHYTFHENRKLARVES